MKRLKLLTVILLASILCLAGCTHPPRNRPKNVFEEMYHDATAYGTPKISEMESMKWEMEKGTMWYTNTATADYDISFVEKDGKAYTSLDVTKLCEQFSGFAEMIEDKPCEDYIHIKFENKESLMGYSGAERIIFEHDLKWNDKYSEIRIITRYVYSFETQELTYEAVTSSSDYEMPEGWQQYLEKDNFLEYIIYDWCASNSKKTTDRSPTEFSYDDWGEVTIVE